MLRRAGSGIPVVTVDSNIWYMDFPRYLLLYLQAFAVCEIQWSNMIRDEFERNLREPPLSLDDEQLEHLYETMVSSLGDPHNLNKQRHLDQISQIKLPDPDDAHVLYLAYLTGSDYLVTNNLKHFPAKKVIKDRLRRVLSLDDFLCEMLKRYEDRFLNAISATMAGMRRKQNTPTEILNQLENKNGCPKICQKLEGYIPYIEAQVASLRQAKA